MEKFIILAQGTDKTGKFWFMIGKERTIKTNLGNIKANQVCFMNSEKLLEKGETLELPTEFANKLKWR